MSEIYCTEIFAIISVLSFVHKIVRLQRGLIYLVARYGKRVVWGQEEGRGGGGGMVPGESKSERESQVD